MSVNLKKAQELRLMALKAYTTAFQATTALAETLSISQNEARRQVFKLIAGLSQELDPDPENFPEHEQGSEPH